jgi:YihY family inner membrane protein
MGTLAQPGSRRPSGRAVIAFGRELRRKALRDDVATHASALTFTAFVSLFPLLLLATSAIGFRLDDRGMESIEQLVRAVPGLDQLVQGQAQAIVDGRYTAGVVGIVGLLWAASALSNRARRALAVIFERHETAVRSRILAIGTTLALGLILVAGVTAAGALTGLIHDRGVSTGWIVAQIGMFALLLPFFLICYRLLVPGGQRLRDLIPAAVVCAAGWTILQGVGSWFVARQVAQWSVLYGTIATVFGVLLFLRIGAWIFLAGAELAATLLAGRPGGTERS